MRYLSLLVVCLVAGCGKLDVKRDTDVEALGFKAYTIDPAKKEQKVTVTVSSPGVPVNVYLVLEKDRAEVEKALEEHQRPKNVLGSQEKTEQATVEGTVPGGVAASVLLYNPSTKTAHVATQIKGS